MEAMKLLMSANADLLSFSLSYYYGILQQSGAIWLAPHSIEKYLKALLSGHCSDIEMKSMGHNLKKLEGKLKYHYNVPTYLSILVDHLEPIDINFRYCESDGYEFPADFFYKIWTTGKWLRKEGNKLYGIQNENLFGVGLAYASPVIRNKMHNQLRLIIDEFECNTKNYKDYHLLNGWVDICGETRKTFI